MAKTAQKSTDVGNDIKIPPVHGSFHSTDDNSLMDMQKDLFDKKPPEKEEKVKENGTRQKKTNRADDIFLKTQTVSQDLKKQTTKTTKDEDTVEGGEDFIGSMPEFDASQFLPTDQDEDTSVDEDIDDNEVDDVELESSNEKGEEPEIDFDKENNLKNLRKIAGGFKKERDDLQTQLKALEQRISSQPDVKALETQLNTLKVRNQELEKYELVFGLQNNPQFKAKFVDSANSVVTEMKQIITDYGLDAEVADQLLLIDNRKDLDEVLEDTFSSSSAINDLKTLKQRYDGIQKERMEAEKKPREVLTKFQSEQAQNEAEVNQRRDAHLKTVMDDGWGAAVTAATQVAKDSRLYELVEQPGKKDHNEKVVQPTLNTAQELYKVGVDYIERLARNKSVMMPSFTQWFAQICQQAAATQMVNHVRWGIYEKYNKLLEQQQQQGKYSRPGITTQGKVSAPSKGGKKKSGKEIAASIFEQVVSET